jgi:hypothetical protein
MGKFDETVGKIIAEINADRAKKKSETDTAAATAETTFGGIGQLIQELQPELDKTFPDLVPELSLGTWVKRGDGVIENTLTLKRVGNSKEIYLAASGGSVRVGKEKKVVPSENAHPAIIQEIVRFFTAN